MMLPIKTEKHHLQIPPFVNMVLVYAPHHSVMQIQNPNITYMLHAYFGIKTQNKTMLSCCGEHTQRS